MWNPQSHRRIIPGQLVFALAILTTGVAPIQADIILHVTGFGGTLEKPTSEEHAGEIFIGAERARIHDHWDYIFDLDRQELIFVEHPEKTYSRVPLPARFEDYIEPAAREFMEREGHPLPGPPTVKIERTGEFRLFGEWRAERVEVDVRDENGEKAEHLTLWMSTDIGVDLDPLEELIRHRAYISERDRRHWIDQFVELEGFPIVQEITRFTKWGESTRTVRVDGVSERDLDESAYEPPEDYTEVRFRSVRVAVPQPLP